MTQVYSQRRSIKIPAAGRTQWLSDSWLDKDNRLSTTFVSSFQLATVVLFNRHLFWETFSSSIAAIIPGISISFPPSITYRSILFRHQKTISSIRHRFYAVLKAPSSSSRYRDRRCFLHSGLSGSTRPSGGVHCQSVLTHHHGRNTLTSRTSIRCSKREFHHDYWEFRIQTTNRTYCSVWRLKSLYVTYIGFRSRRAIQ